MYQTWEELEDSIKNCQKCKLCRARQNIVFELEIKMQLLCLLVKVLEQMKID